MLVVTLTTSMGRFEYHLDAPINDKITLSYASCEYCPTPVRQEKIYKNPGGHKFCTANHRVRYCRLGIATAQRYPVALSAHSR